MDWIYVEQVVLQAMGTKAKIDEEGGVSSVMLFSPA